MPELPEVETVRHYLAAVLPGKVIGKVNVFSQKQFPQDPTLLQNRQIKAVVRKGKLLGLRLDHGQTLLIHLKLTGQLVYVPQLNRRQQAVLGHPLPFAGGNRLPGKSTRVVLYFGQPPGKEGALFFNDVRKFGWLRLVSDQEANAAMAKLGPDATSPAFSLAYFKKVLAGSRRPIKIFIMDQTKISGIGNIYANEALFRAGIDPRRPANSLRPAEISQLYQAIRTILRQSIAAQGTSAADDAYVQADGEPGHFQQQLAVYQRSGQACPRCGQPIKRIKLGGRGTFFCPHCQH